jgi:hypothetical protein
VIVVPAMLVPPVAETILPPLLLRPPLLLPLALDVRLDNAPPVALYPPIVGLFPPVPEALVLELPHDAAPCDTNPAKNIRATNQRVVDSFVISSSSLVYL